MSNLAGLDDGFRPMLSDCRTKKEETKWNLTLRSLKDY
jgi:hypothetical protein